MITLYCSEEENEPTFVEVTETCQYIFVWHTPAACPKNVVTGKDCIVQDSRYGHTFDLNVLRNTTGDYRTSNGLYDYLINICGPLVSQCASNAGVDGICQLHGNEQYSGGLAPGILKYNDGTLTMEYVNGSTGCNGQNRTSQILILCDHNVTNAGPVFFSEAFPCSYTFIWYTIHACTPHKIINCAVHDNGTHYYDLSSLSNSNMNEEYFSMEHNKKYVLNVCRSVVHSKSSPCPFNAGACIIDKDHKEQPKNIGEVGDGPFLENGVLKLLYKDGEKCNDTHNYETVIIFKCNANELFPQLITEENCRFIFSWSSPSACPIEIKKEPEIEGNCTVQNPHSNYVFDLTSLRNEGGYTVQHPLNDQITFNVCGKLKNSPCSDSGACAYNDSKQKYINVGIANSNLQFHHGAIFLEYKNGDFCNNSTRWSILISFVCPAEDSPKRPVLIQTNTDSCTFYISWFIELACERRLDCTVKTNNFNLNFNPLIKHNGNYEITNQNNPSQKFYLNVCRSLNPIMEVNCKPGSSACLYDKNSGEEPKSLGHPLNSPQYIDKVGAVFLYTHGGTCDSKPNLKIASRITFKCNATVGLVSILII